MCVLDSPRYHTTFNKVDAAAGGFSSASRGHTKPLRRLNFRKDRPMLERLQRKAALDRNGYGTICACLDRFTQLFRSFIGNPTGIFTS